MKNKKGFTLLELLVVVLIIGILAAIALPQYKVAVGRAKFATLKNDVRAIKNALDRYYLANNNYITNLDDLDIEIKSSHCSLYPGNPMISCFKIIFGSTMMFTLGYDQRNSIQICFITSNLTNATANKICQLETGKDTPDGDYDSYKSYYYKK